MNQAILLAAYGSTHPSARESLGRVMDMVRAAHPGLPCEVAFTSDHVRRILAERGQHADSVDQALARLKDQGFKRVAMQSLHVIPGREFHELLALANRLMLDGAGFERIEVGFPLLGGEQDVELVADALAKLPPERDRTTEAVLFMGHGSMHIGDVYYNDLRGALRIRDRLAFLGSIRRTGIDGVLEEIKAAKPKLVHLLPFLFGTGHHVSQDMAGADPASWESVLTEEGINCRSVFKGAAEHPALAAIWLAHLDDALHRLDLR